MVKSKSVWLLLSWFLAAAICLLVLKYIGFFENINLDGVTVWLRDLGWLGGLLYIIVYALRPLILFPVTPITLYGGYVFGAFWGTIYDLIGTGAAALISFIIARHFGRGSVEKLIRGKKLQAFDERAEKSGFMVVLYMRLMPFLPFDGVSYGAGLSKVKLWDYMIATMIGIIPGAIVYNVFGASLHDVGSSAFYWSLLMYVLFAVVPFIWKRKAKNKQNAAE